MTTVDILNETKALELALQCAKCNHKLDDPVVVGKCGHTICKKCFSGEFDAVCPLCNIPVTIKDSQEDKQLKSLLSLVHQLKTVLKDESKCVDKILKQNGDKTVQKRLDNNPRCIPQSVDARKTSHLLNTSKAIKRKSVSLSKKGEIQIVKTSESNLQTNKSPFATPENKSKPLLNTPASRKKICHGAKNLNSTVWSPGNLQKRNAKGETPLHVAVIKGDETRVKEFLQQGANPNIKDNCGWTPLHEASNHGYLQIATMLLDHGALVNVPGHQNITPLHDAIMNDKLEVAILLASRGADMYARTSLGNTALDLCHDDKDRNILIEACPTFISPNLVLPNTKTLEKESKIVFLPTSLDDSQKNTLQKCAAMLKADVVDDYTQDVTHIIVNCDEMGHCNRTLKILMGMLGGKWIMNYQWVEVCLEYKEKVEEEVFEVPGIKNQPNYQGPKCAREIVFQQLPPLFDGCFFYLHGQFSKPIPERKDLCNLIHQGGGKILTREPRQDTVDLKPHMIPYHASDTTLEDISHFILYQDKPPRNIHIRSGHICTVHVLWLIECISAFKLLDPSKVCTSK